jgi:hypothetical protein
MVASYTWGMDADRFDGLTSDDIIAQCLEDIAVIHNRDLVSIPLFSGSSTKKLDCLLIKNSLCANTPAFWNKCRIKMIGN